MTVATGVPPCEKEAPKLPVRELRRYSKYEIRMF